MSSAMCVDVPNESESGFRSSRKRPRACDEDCCELMPISKRINDLHIRSGMPEQSTSMNPSVSGHPGMNGPQEMMQANVNMYMSELHRQQSMAMKNSGLPSGYCPELGVTDNPYYYHVNGMLYEAHVQRMQRLSKQIS